MYTYYFLSAFGDTFKPFLGWKKYLTMLQLVKKEKGERDGGGKREGGNERERKEGREKGSREGERIILFSNVGAVFPSTNTYSTGFVHNCL